MFCERSYCCNIYAIVQHYYAVTGVETAFRLFIIYVIILHRNSDWNVLRQLILNNEPPGYSESHVHEEQKLSFYNLGG